jgi:Icc-related predicted phosphoesterase
MKIVSLSDVHTKWQNIKVPPCDLLISAGDYSFKGQEYVVRGFHAWLREQPAKHIISVQGNHEVWVEQNFLEAKAAAQEECPGVHFMEEGLVEIDGFKIWCSSVTPSHGRGWSWNRERGEAIKAHWDRIPKGTNILITHGPAFGVLDEVHEQFAMGIAHMHVGCEELAKAIKRVKPDLHFHGHIHSGYGQHHADGLSSYNSSICDEMYLPINLPHVVDYEIE